MDSDEVEAEVNLTRPALKFDFRTGKRDGNNDRLLVFQAAKATKKEEKKDDKKGDTPKDGKSKDDTKLKDPMHEKKNGKDDAVTTGKRKSNDAP